METVLREKHAHKPPSKASNLTGVPIQMKLDFERRSGLSFDNVRVHYHSAQPAKLGALAYTQGEQVYIGPGQEKHLRHELTHVAQQKQGLAAPTGTAGGFPINDDPKLERLAENGTVAFCAPKEGAAVVQRVPTPGQAAEARFSQLVDWTRLDRDQLNILGNGNAANAVQDIIQELIAVGLPGAMANRIAARVSVAIGITHHVVNHDYFLNQIRNEYTYQPNVQLGADFGAPQNTPEHNLLVQLLIAHFLPLVGPAAPAGAAPIQYTINPRAHVNNKQHIIDEGIGRMNRLLVPQLPRGAPLPPVEIDDTAFGGVTFSRHNLARHGKQLYGLGAGPSQVMHEQGHHLENYLGVNDFANLHNYLYRRSDPVRPERESGWDRLAGIQMNVPTGGPGYNVKFPEMHFQNIISRNLPSGNGLIRFALFNAGNALLYEAASLFGQNDRGQQFIDDFFLEESNSNSTGYASHYKSGEYGTEFLSTTAELLSTLRGAQTVINSDPTRVALFIYMANRPLYLQIAQLFQQSPNNLQGITLDDFLHLL